MQNTHEALEKLEIIQAQMPELRMLQADIGARLAALEGEFFMLKHELADAGPTARNSRNSN